MTDYRSRDRWAQHHQVSYSPVDPAFQWDYSGGGGGGGGSPTNMVSHYNDLLQRAADFYATLDNSFDTMSSSGSDASYRSTPERRISSSTNVVAQVKSSIPDKIERRREQNRSSQRAYRERKERHQKELEEQISQWQQKHQALTRSYSQQSEEVNRLKSQVEQLNSEISQLQTGFPSFYGSMCQSPQEFDLVPFFDSDSLSPIASPPSSSHVSGRRRS